MPEMQDATCVRPVAKVESVSEATKATPPATGKPQGDVMIRVGQKAPDFTAAAYIDGGFGTVTLSEYLGKWVVLCFYPGDFTFV